LYGINNNNKSYKTLSSSKIIYYNCKKQSNNKDMNIKELIKENKEEIINYLLTIVNDKTQTHKPSVKLKFKALGKTYNSNKTIENYVNFITDLSNIHSYETFKPIMKSFICDNQDGFSRDHTPSVIKINNGFYLSKKVGNEIKERHINEISKVLNIPIIKL